MSADAAFGEEFQRKFDERGGWDMAGIAEWPDAPDVVTAYQAVHHHNCSRLRAIVEENGWPMRSSVGEDGADAAWLLLQHFGDSAFQDRCLELLAELPRSERDLKHYAFTFDLLCKVRGDVPRFGTMGLPVSTRTTGRVEAQFDLPSLESQEASREAGLVVLPAGIGRRTPGFEWPADR